MGEGRKRLMTFDYILYYLLLLVEPLDPMDDLVRGFNESLDLRPKNLLIKKTVYSTTVSSSAHSFKNKFLNSFNSFYFIIFFLFSLFFLEN